MKLSDRKNGIKDGGKDSQDMEYCVLCRKVTDIPRNIPVDERKYYIQGAGQLCRACYHKVYDSEL